MFAINKKLVFLLFVFSHVFINSQTVPDSLNIIQISIPKAGTNLLGICLSVLTGERRVQSAQNKNHYLYSPKRLDQLIDWADGHIAITHALFNLKHYKKLSDINICKFFIYRDPRDQVVSFAHFMKKNLHQWPQAQELSLDEIIMDLITKGSYYNDMPPVKGGVAYLYDAYLGWAYMTDVCTVRFEDLVGPKGGGSEAAQFITVKRVAKHLGLEVSDQKTVTICRSIFGKAETFREGQIGSWKKHFTDEHKKAFKQHANQLLLLLGYEKDDNW